MLEVVAKRPFHDDFHDLHKRAGTAAELGFARAVTRTQQWCASRRVAGDVEQAVEQMGRYFPHVPVVR
jgi:hypothetical protein